MVGVRVGFVRFVEMPKTRNLRVVLIHNVKFITTNIVNASDGQCKLHLIASQVSTRLCFRLTKIHGENNLRATCKHWNCVFANFIAHSIQFHGQFFVLYFVHRIILFVESAKMTTAISCTEDMQLRLHVK